MKYDMSTMMKTPIAFDVPHLKKSTTKTIKKELSNGARSQLVSGERRSVRCGDFSAYAIRGMAIRSSRQSRRNNGEDKFLLE